MAGFNSWRSYGIFANVIEEKMRFALDKGVRSFLRATLKTAQKYVRKIPRNTFLWRAQLGHGLRQDDVGDNYPAPFDPERMKPLPDRAKEGRVNPKGIPCLYLATHRETALAEVRPWKGTLISVGQFKTLQPLRVIDCTSAISNTTVYLGKEPSQKRREKIVWADIDKSFSTPVTPSDDSADYAPTQLIAEMFKVNKFDGIAYRSALGQGHNIALFSLSSAEIVSCHLYELKDIKFKFGEIANPYWIEKNGTNRNWI